jgi:hypothetical protein
MPTNTYVALDKVTVGTATSSITFSSIPQGYTDLVLVVSAATTHTLSTFPYVQFNGDTSTNYSVTDLYGTGSATGSARESNSSLGWIGFDVSISTTVGDNVTRVSFMNYSNSTTYKTWLSRADRASSALDYQGTNAVVGLWRSTAAVTSMTVKNRRSGVDYNFAAGSTFSLYGIASASVGAKATGGDIYADSQYFYHVFDASGTFTPTQSITADIMVIAGGGGGGCDGAGGGGAGGFRVSTSRSMTATAYSCTIGAGGAGSGSNSFRGFKGSTSTIDGTGFAQINSTGGGGGGSSAPVNTGQAGGSGGGARSNTSGAGGAGNEGGYSPVEGFAGASTTASVQAGSGGGGGAGGAGTLGDGTITKAGAGGIGNSSYSSWATATGTGVDGAYAGGGGGGVNDTSTESQKGVGVAGGGNGGWQTGVATVGRANTGGGGGGGAYGAGFTDGRAGGSGLVIVRYLKA